MSSPSFMAFLPSTCISLVDKLTEQQVSTEYLRLKDASQLTSSSTSTEAGPSSTLLKTSNSPKLTRSKLSISHKKDAIKAALLNSISANSIKTLSLEDKILSSLEDIKKQTIARIQLKDVATATEDDTVNTMNVSTSTDIVHQTGFPTSSADVSTMTTPDSAPQAVNNHPSISPAQVADVTTASSGSNSAKRPPPFGLPGSLSNPKKDILLGKHSSRTLFLTDSIMSSVSATSL